MKKALKMLALTAALAAMFSISAFASDFDHCADALNEMGLFQGTSTGYDLDRAPTRAEASAMLVRLLGQEEAAQELTYTAPFTDVLDWAKPYVQYLYENGLANGKSDTIYGASDPCTAQQYATFLMRALGYSDADGDFTYAEALDFATEKGVVNAFNCDATNFLRDDVVAMSYTALSVAPKSGEVDLLTKLVNDGAITDAKGYDELFVTYRDYSKAVSAQADQSHMTMDLNMAVTAADMDVMDATMKLDVAMDLNEEALDQSKMAMTGTFTANMNEALVEDPTQASTTQDIAYYYTDGVYYMAMGEEKYQMPLSFEEALGSMDLSNMTSSDPLCFLTGLTATTNGNTTVYTVEYAPGAFSSILDMAAGMGMDTAGVMDPQISISDCKVTVTNGTVTGMDATIDMAATVEGITTNITMDLKCTMDNQAVSVNLPTDLSTYLPMEEMAA